MNTFGQRVKDARLKLGITQAELARRANLSQQAITKIENDKNQRSMHIAELANALGLSEKYLQTGEEGSKKSFIDIKLSDWSAIDQVIDKKQLAISENYIYLRVEDDSMTHLTPGEPSFPKGTIIIIEPNKKPEHGRFVIAKLKDKPESKPIFRKYNTDYLSNDLIPLNFSSFRMYSADNFDIIGVVVASMYLDL